MITKVTTIKFEDWVIKFREPGSTNSSKIILMLHGWTGDENSMWVFSDRLPKHAYVLAPRGLFDTPLGGYGWHKYNPGAWPWVDDFLPAVESLHNLLHSGPFYPADISVVNLVGFSQGAALAFAFALKYPSRVDRIAGLSGFLPEGSDALLRNKPLKGKPIFIAHGEQDRLVPVDKARQAVKLLESAGSQVTYCEDDVGHKLSMSCYRGLENFFAATST